MPAQKCILIVEDNEINRMTLYGLLSPQYKILEAENGREALDILKDNKERISLILLDIAMPVMDGYAFLSVAKKDPAYAAIPVIVTTQSDSDADEVAALSHGAEDFVTKPYKPEILLNRVASTIRFRETAAMVNQFQYDHLTGLYSKLFFCQKVREILMQDPDQPYDLICSDVENFKLVNDVLGNKCGDDLLCEIAKLCETYTGKDGVCGRLNADRFACLVKRGREYTDETFLKLSKHISILSNNKSVDIKWGIFPIEDRGLPVEQMCDRAMLALRSIKGKYGNYFAVYDSSLRDELLRQQAIIDSMETALQERQFEVYFQPKYRIWDDRLAGAEALIRWKHPEWGMLSPAEFIPLFEKNGFITKLDQFVWEEVCRILKVWEGKGYPSLPVSVNVSRADIYSVDITDLLLNIIRKYDLDPAQLHLEITESAYTENPQQLIEVVSRLREHGFIIEMDDFGSGYSSLNMLNQMPMDILKLDMKFIQNETTKVFDQGILQFIMNLARWMHLRVVAEGVETREQLDRLMEADCDYVQGYFFARPMRLQDYETFVEKEKAEGKALEALASDEEDRIESFKQVLFVADEDKQYIEQVRKNFSERFHIVSAMDTDAALKRVSACKDKIAALLLSYSLPGAGALTVLDMVRQNRELWNIPVIVAGPADESAEEKVLLCGAADYAVKPHSQNSLIKRISHAIRLNSFQAREKLLQEAAFRDCMTGVLNRRGWEAALHAIHKTDAPMAICFFDIDDLKRINDMFGHGEGDRRIIAFSKVIRAGIRESDILARIGGDQFIVVMKFVKSPDAALQRCRDICDAFRDVSVADGMQTTASVGVAMWNADCEAEEIIRQVDEALHRAKDAHADQCFLL